MLFTIPFSGSPGPTTRIACSDTADNLADEYDSGDGAPAVGAILTAEVGDIRFTMGGNITTPTYPPTQGASGLGHILYEGQSLALSSGRQVRTFQFIAHTNGTTPTLMVTCLFEAGK